jgi:hypothetical protein
MRRRCVGFSETDDLTQFPPLRMIMAPDDIDDLWCKPGTVQRTHFYACPSVAVRDHVRRLPADLSGGGTGGLLSRAALARVE